MRPGPPQNSAPKLRPVSAMPNSHRRRFPSRRESGTASGAIPITGTRCEMSSQWNSDSSPTTYCMKKGPRIPRPAEPRLSMKNTLSNSRA